MAAGHGFPDTFGLPALRGRVHDGTVKEATVPRVLPSTAVWSALGACLCAGALACGSDESGGEEGPVVVGSDVPANAVSEPAASGAPSPAVDGLLAGEPALGGSCTPRLGAETFTSAVCSCEGTSVAGYLKTDAFASANPGGAVANPAAGLAPGSVSVNGDYATAGYANVFGSFTVAGDRSIAFGGFLRAGEDVRVNPSLDVAGVVDVGRDAFLRRDARVFGRVDIARDLYLGTGAALNGIAIVDVGGERRSEAVSIEAPCACGADRVIDVSALVDAAEADNDNARAGLDQDALNVVVGIGAEATLAAGRYFIHQLGGLGSLTLHVTGKVALFVGDDVIAAGAFRVELEPDAELDLFVRDNLVITGAALFGDPERPSATRIYVGGTGDVAIAGVSAFVGNLYAPRANILVGGLGQARGALFGKNVIAAGFLDLGYDASIRDAGDGCPPLEPADIPRIR